MNYGHESDDLTAGKFGPYTCKRCGKENFEPSEDAPCPEKIIQEAVKKAKEEIIP